MDVYRGLDSATNSWSGLAGVNDYRERISYDGNGNIKTYVRHGFGSTIPMDSLTYNYYAGTNQLNQVNDGVSSTNYTTDIDDQPANNFRYDSIGNMIADSLSDVRNIDWTMYGKIALIYKQPRVPGDAISIEYRYDPLGNRVSKGLNKYSDRNEYVWYVRDAQGNVMAVYDMKYNWDHSFGPFRLIEHHIYGSSRLGIIQRDQDMDSAKANATNESLLGSTYVYNTDRGQKLYELTNHLGNVLTTVSDRKIGHGTHEEYDYYAPDIVSATDYYPFGSPMPNRSFSASNYRYGFNGKENDNEIKGEGDQQDYGMRIYDPRLGRFLSIDPLSGKYAMLTPYQFSSNSPIASVDIDGLESNEHFNYNDPYFLQFFRGLSKSLLGHDLNFTAPPSADERTTIADPTLPYRSRWSQQLQQLWEMAAVLTGDMDLKETQYFKQSVALSEKLANWDGESVGVASGDLIKLFFLIRGAGAAYTQYVEAAGSESEFTQEWNQKGIRQFSILDEVKITEEQKKQLDAAHSGAQSAEEATPSEHSKVKFSAIPKASELRDWAKEQGYELLSNENGIEQWGIKETNQWRLKIKDPSTTPGVHPNSQKPRYSARNAEGQYYDPVTGNIGSRKNLGHQDLDPD